jgi:uncharacterized protein
MSAPLSDLGQLLRAMEPVLQKGVYVFASLPHGTDLNPLDPIATIRETEGITVVVKEKVAEAHSLPVLFRAAWITLTVHSDLQAVGLTAAFAQALGRENISCDVVAGAFHDHIFVPVEQAEQAMSALRALQQDRDDSPA